MLLPHITILIVGTMIFMIGLHNIDNSWNMRYFEYTFDTTLVDENFVGNGLTSQQLYNVGMLMTLIGFLLSILSSSTIFLKYSKQYIRKRL